jgi:adenylate cyclase
VDVDLPEFEAAGLLDVDEGQRDVRLALLRYLTAEGATVADMVGASEHRRLFALAAERIGQPTVLRLRADQMAEAVEAPIELTAELVDALGFGSPSGDALREITLDELVAVRVLVDFAQLVGIERAVATAQLLSAVMNTFAEGVSSTVRSSFAEASVALSDELTAAVHFAERMPYLTALQHAFYPAFRRAGVAARTQFERAMSYDIVLQGRARLAIGFVDLSGFTQLSSTVDLRVIDRLLVAFEDLIRRQANDNGARVVKFIGDEAMIVAPDPDGVLKVLSSLVARGLEADGVVVLARAGIGYGEVLARNGDYFGSPVNLAARLVAVAAPGCVLVSESVVSLLDAGRWEVVKGPPVPLRGFTDPIVPWQLRYPSD